MAITVNRTHLNPFPIKTVSGEIVTIDDALARDALGLTVRLEPVQEGIGDPSPDNVRPISGHDGVSVWDDPLYGGSVNWNQLNQYSNAVSSYSKYGLTFSPLDDCFAFRVTGDYFYPGGDRNSYIYNQRPAQAIQSGHVYIATNTSQYLCVYLYGASFAGNKVNASPMGGVIVKATSSANLQLSLHAGSNIPNGTAFNETVYVTLTDLTLAFGDTKAEELYQMEQAARGSGVAYFKSLFPRDWYPYNAGQVACVSEINGDPYWKKQVTFPETVYGGTVDLVSGVLTVTHAVVDLGTIAWVKSSATSSVGGSAFSRALTAIGDGMAPRERYAPNTMLCEAYAPCDNSMWFINNMPDFSMFAHTTRLYIADSRYNDADTFKTAMSGVKLVYELATPIEIPLTPVEITTLLGQNNIWSDAGITTLTYRTRRSK